jgi:hypothetical protein
MTSPRCPRIRGVLAVLLSAPAVQAGSVPLNADFSATVDDAGGHSIDADFTLSPTERLSLNLGGGQSTGADDTANLRGTLLNAGVSLHGDRAGVALSYDRFDDSSNYRSSTFGGRLSMTAGDFEISLLGRRRDMSLELTLELPNRTLSRSVDFAAVGGGLQLAFSHGNFSGYAMGMMHDYDDDFDDFLSLAQSPQLAERPLIEALVGSIVTQAQGAIDRQFGAGVGRTFGRHAVGLDVSSVRDAIDGTTSTSVGRVGRYRQLSADQPGKVL